MLCLFIHFEVANTKTNRKKLNTKALESHNKTFPSFILIGEAYREKKTFSFLFLSFFEFTANKTECLLHILKNEYSFFFLVALKTFVLLRKLSVISSYLLQFETKRFCKFILLLNVIYLNDKKANNST